MPVDVAEESKGNLNCRTALSSKCHVTLYARTNSEVTVFFFRAYHRISELEGTFWDPLLKQGHPSQATHNHVQSCSESLHNLSGQPALGFDYPCKNIFLVLRRILCLFFFFFWLLACHWDLPRKSTLPRRAWLPHLHLLNIHLWYVYTLIRPEPPEFQTFPRLKSPNS